MKLDFSKINENVDNSAFEDEDDFDPFNDKKITKNDYEDEEMFDDFFNEETPKFADDFTTENQKSNDELNFNFDSYYDEEVIKKDDVEIFKGFNEPKKEEEQASGKLDFSSDEYELIRNINPDWRQSVNEEYDGLLREKKIELEPVNTSIKFTLPAQFSKGKKEIILTEKDIENMKNPSKMIERKNVKTLDEIEMEDIENYVEDELKKGVYIKQKRKERVNVKHSDNLILKIIEDPSKYIKFKFDDRLVFNSYELGLLGYDCVIRPDGRTLFDDIRERTTDKKSYTDTFEKAMILDRAKITSNEYFKSLEIRDRPIFRAIDKERSGVVRKRKEKRESVSNVDAFKEKENISNMLGIDVSELNNLIKVPNGDKIYSYSDRLRWSRHYKSGDKILMLTYEDRDMLRFLGQFKYSIANILKNISGESYSITQGRLEKLKNMGLVNNYTIIGVGEIWALTRIGIDMAGYDLGYITAGSLPAPGGISSELGVQFVASYLYNNRVNVLNLHEFPYHGRVLGDEVLPGETLISESQIRKSIRDEVRKVIEENDIRRSPYTGYYTEQVGIRKRESFVEWENMKRNGLDVLSPEFIDGMEYCWSIFPSRSVVGVSYHNPDLVVKRMRTPDGKPQSIAIEVERKNSSPEDYRNTFMAYAMDNNTFKYVVWITPTSANANKIKEGAKLAKFRNYKVLPLINENGGMNVNDFWQLAYK